MFRKCPVLKRRLERISLLAVFLLIPFSMALNRIRAWREGQKGRYLIEGESRAVNRVCQYFPEFALSAFSEETFKPMSCSVKISLCRWTLLVQVIIPDGRGAKFCFTPILCQALFYIRRKSSTSILFKHIWF